MSTLYRRHSSKLDCIKQLFIILILFRNCKSIKDYGSSLAFPYPPKALQETGRKFESMFMHWRGYMIIKKVTPEDRDMLRRKLLAWELVGAGSGNGGRQNWGMNRRWYGDYLSQENMDPEYNTTVQDIRTKDGVNNIIFSSKVLFININKGHLISIHCLDEEDQQVQENKRQTSRNWMTRKAR